MERISLSSVVSWFHASRQQQITPLRRISDGSWNDVVAVLMRHAELIVVGHQWQQAACQWSRMALGELWLCAQGGTVTVSLLDFLPLYWRDFRQRVLHAAAQQVNVLRPHDHMMLALRELHANIVAGSPARTQLWYSSLYINVISAVTKDRVTSRSSRVHIGRSQHKWKKTYLHNWLTCLRINYNFYNIKYKGEQ